MHFHFMQRIRADSFPYLYVPLSHPRALGEPPAMHAPVSPSPRCVRIRSYRTELAERVRLIRRRPPYLGDLKATHTTLILVHAHSQL